MGRPKNFSREEVLEKAIPLFWKQGFADTSLQDLERATGVNKSGLYAEFQSKEELYIESLRHYMVTHDGGVLAAMPPGWKNVESFLMLSCPTGQKGCFAINSMRELAVVPAEAHGLVTGNLSTLKKMLMQNIAAEKTKMDPAVVADMVLTFFTGLCMEQNLGMKKSTTVRKVEELMQVLRAL